MPDLVTETSSSKQSKVIKPSRLQRWQQRISRARQMQAAVPDKHPDAVFPSEEDSKQRFGVFPTEITVKSSSSKNAVHYQDDPFGLHEECQQPLLNNFHESMFEAGMMEAYYVEACFDCSLSSLSSGTPQTSRQCMAIDPEGFIVDPFDGIVLHDESSPVRTKNRAPLSTGPKPSIKEAKMESCSHFFDQGGHKTKQDEESGGDGTRKTLSTFRSSSLSDIYSHSNKSSTTSSSTQTWQHFSSASSTNHPKSMMSNDDHFKNVIKSSLISLRSKPTPSPPTGKRNNKSSSHSFAASNEREKKVLESSLLEYPAHPSTRVTKASTGKSPKPLRCPSPSQRKARTADSAPMDDEVGTEKTPQTANAENPKELRTSRFFRSSTLKDLGRDNRNKNLSSQPNRQIKVDVAKEPPTAYSLQRKRSGSLPPLKSPIVKATGPDIMRAVATPKSCPSIRRAATLVPSDAVAGLEKIPCINDGSSLSEKESRMPRSVRQSSLKDITGSKKPSSLKPLSSSQQRSTKKSASEEDDINRNRMPRSARQSSLKDLGRSTLKQRSSSQQRLAKKSASEDDEMNRSVSSHLIGVSLLPTPTHSPRQGPVSNEQVRKRPLKDAWSRSSSMSDLTGRKTCLCYKKSSALREKFPQKSVDDHSSRREARSVLSARSKSKHSVRSGCSKSIPRESPTRHKTVKSAKEKYRGGSQALSRSSSIADRDVNKRCLSKSAERKRPHSIEANGRPPCSKSSRGRSQPRNQASSQASISDIGGRSICSNNSRRRCSSLSSLGKPPRHMKAKKEHARSVLLSRSSSVPNLLKKSNQNAKSKGRRSSSLPSARKGLSRLELSKLERRPSTSSLSLNDIFSESNHSIQTKNCSSRSLPVNRHADGALRQKEQRDNRKHQVPTNHGSKSEGQRRSKDKNQVSRHSPCPTEASGLSSGISSAPVIAPCCSFSLSSQHSRRKRHDGNCSARSASSSSTTETRETVVSSNVGCRERNSRSGQHRPWTPTVADVGSQCWASRAEQTSATK